MVSMRGQDGENVVKIKLYLTFLCATKHCQHVNSECIHYHKSILLFPLTMIELKTAAFVVECATIL